MWQLTVLWIIFGLLLALLVLTALYAFVRVPWRLWRGDVDSAGSDSQTWAGDDKPKPT